MSGERLGRQARKELTRRLLLDAAAAIFSRRGFDAASLDEVADAAGFTKGAVYSNFRSKTDLFMALIERRLAEQLVAASSALAGATLDEAIERLESSSDPAVSSGRDWLLLMYEFWHYAMRDERARKALAEQYERARTITARMITEKYTEAGTQPPMPARELAILIEAIGIGLGFQAALDPGAVPAKLQGAATRRLLAMAPERNAPGDASSG
jgi:AcrR family transcriptional regulator